uniref:Uncharacterized protein n=1 Tax=Terrapene triunguis TaxID=2587831 RepID=A0A674IVQ1_9SAUR
MNSTGNHQVIHPLSPIPRFWQTEPRDTIPGDKDFPPAAVQVAHQKPQPCLEKFDAMLWGNQHIHQPCK